MEEIMEEREPDYVYVGFDEIDEAIEEQTAQYLKHPKNDRNKYYSKKVLTNQIPLRDGKRETILQWLYDINIVNWYVTYLLNRHLDDEDVEDKIQEIWTMLCEKKQEEWDKLYEQGYYAVSAYVSGLIHRQIRSDTSKIYRKYNKYRENVITKDEAFWMNYEQSENQ